MDMILNTVLKSVEGGCILNIDGSERSCESSVAALNAIDSAVVYAIQKIGVKDGKVCIAVHDRTADIVQQNKAWVEEEKKKTGTEPSFF